jgi:hypothetical protein
VTNQDVADATSSHPDGGGASKGTVESVVHETGKVAETARSAAGEVAGEAGNQALAVLDQAKSQATDLVGTTKAELKEQAQVQTQRAASGLSSLADQMQALAQGRPQDAGRLTEWASVGQHRLSTLSSRLDEQGLDGVLHDISGFARRRPMAFLAGCLATGFLLGRLIKDAAAAGSNSSAGATLPAPSGTQPAMSGPDSRLSGPQLGAPNAFEADAVYSIDPLVTTSPVSAPEPLP